MSTPETGDAATVKSFVDDAKALIAAASAETAQQLDLLDPVTPEDMLVAREALGPEAGRLAVLRHAREEKRRGRPPGAKNKRTDEFKRYIMGFGQHPAITMMQIQSTPPELLIEASKQDKVHSFRKNGEPNMVVERMTYEAAQALRTRCAEGLLPYLESKQPVAVDMTFNGVADMIIEGVTHTRDELDSIMEADFAPVDEDLPVHGEGGDDE